MVKRGRRQTHNAHSGGVVSDYLISNSTITLGYNTEGYSDKMKPANQWAFSVLEIPLVYNMSRKRNPLSINKDIF